MSCRHQMQDQDGINRQLPIINAYSESLSNLQVLADGYPSLEYVQSISAMRQTGYSMDDIGEGKNSDGPELIISVDDCPTWINLWGGANTVVQALWKVKNTRSEAEGFISKLSAEDTQLQLLAVTQTRSILQDSSDNRLDALQCNTEI